MARVVQFVGPSSWLPDRKTAGQRSINCYPMPTEDTGGDTPLVLESAPGLSLVHDFGAAVRGLRNVDGRLFVVAGVSLSEVSTSDAVSTVGTVVTGGTVSMADGIGQLVIVCGALANVFNLDNGSMSILASGGWLGSQTVDYLDGYFIFVDPATQNFYLSAIDDAGSIDPLDFSSADTQPDNTVSTIVHRRELFLMGSRSTEVWINSGGADFPLARYQGTPIDVGIVGWRARCIANDSLIWIGQTKQGGPYVYQLQGYQPVRISTQAVERQLQASTDIASARMWSYQDAGGEFVIVDSPGMQTSWAYDFATKLWHERGELSEGAWTQSRIEHHSHRSGIHYVAGGTKLYRMSRNYSSLAGDALVRERTWPHLVEPELDARTYAMLEVRCTTGEDPHGNLTLEISNDGAVFGPPLLRSLGVTGRRSQRVRWMPLGTCPAGGARVFRLRCSDAVPLTIQGATIV